MTKPRKTAGGADDYVGLRIRERRIMLGWSQQQLAEMIGVTYQQAHKYERGINRVSVGRLYEIARVTTTPLASFLEGLVDKPPLRETPVQRRLLESSRNLAQIENE